MKCIKCNTELMEGSKYCTNCGNKVDSSSGVSFLWGILGFFIPIVGLILFLVWKDTNKSDSKAAGIGALVGFLLKLMVIIVMLVIIFGITTDLFYSFFY